MLRSWLLLLSFAAVASCGSPSLPCARDVAGGLGNFEGYQVIAGERGAIVVVGKGTLPWRALYAAPRNCGAPGDGAGNPMLLARLRSDGVEWIEADGCGEEEVMVTSESAAVDVTRRVGQLLGSRSLGERVTIRVRCAGPNAFVRTASPDRKSSGAVGAH